MELFDEQETRAYIAKRTQELNTEISRMSDENITTCDIEEWTEYLVEKYRVFPITLFDDDMSMRVDRTTIKRPNLFAGFSPYEPKYCEVDGYKITVTLPYDGDASLFRLKPCTRLLSRFAVSDFSAPHNEDCGTISLSFEYTQQEWQNHSDNIREHVLQQFKNEFQGFRMMLGNVESDIHRFNEQLPDLARRGLEARKKKADDFAALHEALEIPLTRSAFAPNVTPVQLKRIVRKPQQPPRQKPMQKEYSISDEDYEKINNVIFSAGTTMEKTARSHYRNYEEELRDILLASLNTHYENATGETFRKVGKADIHIEFENKAAFVGECKIWHGEKALDAAVQQALNYTTWRDVKVSVIIFNKENKDFKGILEKLHAWVGKHTTSHRRVVPNRWECDLYRADAKTVIKLNILAFDLYVDRTQFQDARVD
ncbi:MAG: hypothetical protein IIX28_03220 [Clostridia bacterium]|nr:hypothetical protein [Clostridia bacterium]